MVNFLKCQNRKKEIQIELHKTKIVVKIINVLKTT